MYKAQIIGISVLAGVVYGIVHDQITVRLCVEYFTLAHPVLFPRSSPTVLAFCWGVAATVWVGAALGGILAWVSESDGLPPVSISKLLKAIMILLAITALSAVTAGFAGFELSRKSILVLPADLQAVLSQPRQHWFAAVWFAHITSYFVGIAGGTVLIVALWQQRGRPRVFPLFPRSAPAMIRAAILLAILLLILGFRYSGR